MNAFLAALYYSHDRCRNAMTSIEKNTSPIEYGEAISSKRRYSGKYKKKGSRR